ncbi:hypothetical protein FNV43_RR23784 [Rhamnella rubrinervis]|uniref:Uncharacterized protein n=1 Tax=Rhamnella rubrinervis TaxID=2594499 RepID=A0A8K0DWV8_9ROSA|nr:hypothetical protein FNV43_RR23784 [Rhamnella rubrinervis]
MDFHSLARKELQALCKKNKIPANITNIAMAEALSALEHVEGLDELFDQSKSDLQQSPEKTMKVPDVPRTACRTSTRRKPVREQPESSQPLTRTRGGTKGSVVEEVDQERSNVPKTPAALSSRRRAPAASASQKEETSVQTVYGTRRSVRLLEKNMQKLSMKEDGKPGPLKIDELTREIFSGSEKSDGSSFEKGECMQTSLEVCSEKIEDTEVSSEMKDDVQENNNHEDLKSKSKLEPEVLLADSGVIMEASEEGSGESDIHLVEKSDKIMGAKDKHEDGKGPDDNTMDLNADQIVGTEDSLAAKISDDVSANGMNQVIAGQTSVLQEENELLSEEECVEPIRTLSSSEMVSGEVKSFESAEGTAKHEGLTLSFSIGKSRVFNREGCVMNVADNDYRGQFDFEAESEEESDDGSSEQLSDYQSEDDFTEGELSGDEFELQQRDATACDSVPKMDKYNTTDLVDIDVIETDITTGSHPLSDGRPGLMKQVPCDMVSGSEVEFSTSSATIRKNPCHADNEMEEEYGPLVDVYVSEEDFDSVITHETPTSVKKMSPYLGNMTSGSKATVESAFPPSLLSGQFPCPTLSAPRKSPIPKRDVVDDNETPTSVKKMSPYLENMTSGGKATGESAFPPNQLSGQFPRPTLSASRKSPIPKRDVVDDNEKVEGDEVKKNDGFDGLSIRELKKMLKHKLEIESNKNDTKDKKDAKHKVGKTRTALQTLPENRLAINEPVDDK